MVRHIIDWFEKQKGISVLIVVAGFIIILYPRFNRNDIALIRPFVGLELHELSPDTKNYIHFTEYFKHTMPLDSVAPPYSYRPLAPYAASFLPVDSLLGIDIVNVISLLFSVICLFFILKKYSFSFGYCIAGCLLFIFSFPFFYYGVVGYLDPPVVFMVSLIVLATVQKKYFALPILLVIGAFVKEAVIVTFPFIFLYAYQAQGSSKLSKILDWTFILLSVVFFLVGYMYCRSTFSTINNYLWSPSLSSVLANAIRPKSYLSFILTFGPVGILAWLEIRSDRKKFYSVGKRSIMEYFRIHPDSPLLASCLLAFALWIYTFVAAYVDGRYFWIGYPFLIPLAVKYLRERSGITAGAKAR